MSITPVEKQDDVDPASRLLALISKAEPRIRSVFLRAVRNAKSQINLTDLADLIQEGRLEEAFLIAEAIPPALGASLAFTVIESGGNTATLITRVLGRPLTFDQTNHRAVNIMQQNRLDLISQFTQQQREATREAIVEGIRTGVGPREQARNFRDSIGLTSKQVRAVNNFKLLLENNSRMSLTRKLRDKRFDPTIIAAIDNDEPLSKTQINRMVTRYRERYLKYRSEVIARTEALKTVHQGSEEMYRQAFDSGALDPAKVVRSWVDADDTRVRHSHDGMGGQQRAVGEAFISDAGNFLQYPGDPSAPIEEIAQCRCVITTRFI